MSDPSHHAINYVELSVTDLPAAVAFYGAAFGWTFNTYGPSYVGICNDGHEVGGMCAVEANDGIVLGAKGAPLVVLHSNDLEASVKSVGAAGGTIVQEIFSFPGGRRFHFADPSGNELAVWAAK